MNSSATLSAPARPVRSGQALRWAFCACVLALAMYQFSENTADPDLWTHTMLGEQSLLTHSIQRTEIYSWTARGHPFVNHEVLAEAALGASHLLLGGAGILLLKILFGFLAFGIALRLGAEGLRWPERAFAWIIGAVAVVEISFGFAARPQIFTAVFLAVEFWVLRRIHREKFWWALVLPALYALWINTHGGVLAGLVVMLTAAGTTTAQFLWQKFSRTKTEPFNVVTVSPKTAVVLCLSCVACFGAMFANAWGFDLIRWIVGAVLWPRPEIEEWTPTRLGWDHAAVFYLMGFAAIAFLFSRRPRVLWEMAVCAVLAFFALRSVRHTPLFSIAVLAFVPRHLADVFARYQAYFSRFEQMFRRGASQTLLTIVLGALSIGMAVATFTLHKEHPLTMEVPRNRYPVAAVAFMREHDLRGNMLSFFDWGEMCLWELPDCALSLDGRMDDCYPHETILEHWNFYNDQPVDKQVLDIDRADVALLPCKLAGALALQRRGWLPVYADAVAVVLVRDPALFPKLPREGLPVLGGAGATTGRAAFPDAVCARVAQTKSR